MWLSRTSGRTTSNHWAGGVWGGGGSCVLLLLLLLLLGVLLLLLLLFLMLLFKTHPKLELLTTTGAGAIIFQAIRNYIGHRELVMTGLRLIGNFCRNAAIAAQFGNEGVISLLLHVIDIVRDVSPIALWALAGVIRPVPGNQMLLLAQGGAEYILQMLRASRDCTDEAGVRIATWCCHVLLVASETNPRAQADLATQVCPCVRMVLVTSEAALWRAVTVGVSFVYLFPYSTSCAQYFFTKGILNRVSQLRLCPTKQILALPLQFVERPRGTLVSKTGYKTFLAAPDHGR